MKVPGIGLADVGLSTGFSGDEMALILQDSNLVLRQLSDILAIDQNLPRVIAQASIPFVVMPGDSAANGCQFTGTNGAFTLSAAIIANIWSSLTGCYAYFSANFGGSSLPAGWYWTEFSSDTAGIVYAETYTSGKVRRPATKTPITPNLSGWVTGTTIEVTGPTGFVLPGNALGKNGNLRSYFRQVGSTTGNKNIKIYLNSTQIGSGGSSASPFIDLQNMFYCLDSHTQKNVGRLTANASTGLSVAFGTMTSATIVSVDTSVDCTVSLSLQGSSNLSAPVLLGFDIAATYGE